MVVNKNNNTQANAILSFFNSRVVTLLRIFVLYIYTFTTYYLSNILGKQCFSCVEWKHTVKLFLKFFRFFSKHLCEYA